MTSGPGEPPRPGPVARLLGSLANALLDLGLPTIRDWLRERLGPASDVGQVITDGSLVHLDGVRVPIGPRGLVALERATAVITGLGPRGLPEIRLHAFTGVLGFGGGAFRAEVSFTAAPEPDATAWIWGDLTIQNASWTEREGSPHTNPMNGSARLFVSSREWRLDRGRLDGQLVRARFAGGGVFEQDKPEVPPEEPLLVPPALSSITLSLEHALVGPFVDAASALVGHAIAIPSFVPLDAALDGDLAWRSPSATSGETSGGGSVDLRIGSTSLRAHVHGTVGATGNALDVQVDADVHPAPLLRGGGAPGEALPREEDVVRVELAIGGELRRPEVKGTLRAAELGFRLGRPRFVPAVVLRGLESELFVKKDRAVLRAVVRAHHGTLTLDADGNLRDLASARGTLRSEGLEAVFFREVVATIGARVHVPEDALGALDFTLVPSEAGAAIDGKVTLATASSKIELAITPRSMRLTGGVAAPDAVATGIFAGAVVPSEGEVVIGLDVFRERGRLWAHGTVGSKRLALALPGRPDVPHYIIEGAAADVAVDAAGIVYGQLRFRASGADFLANGTIPFGRERSPSELADHNPLLVLQLEEGGAELIEALARLADGVQIRAAGDGAHPTDELWVPRKVTAHGHLRLDADLSLTADVNLGTPAGSALALGLRLRDGRLLGSTLAGRVALSDAIGSGALGSGYELEGIAVVDARVSRQSAHGPVVLLRVSAERLVVTAAGASFAATELAGTVRFDAGELAWSRVAFRAYDGAIRSSGIWTSKHVLLARMSLSGIGVHELPEIAGRSPSTYVRGRLTGSVVVRTDANRSFRAGGDVLLDGAAFPALDLVRPSLARYGLRPPSEDASAPVTATIVGTEWGVLLRDVKVDLRGATVRGGLGVSRDRVLEGEANVTLEEEYLRTSKLLTLPRVLSQQLVIPIRVSGPIEQPRVHAGLGESLEHFIKENRVSAFVTSAVEEAQLLFGRHPSRKEHEEEETFPGPELENELRQALEAHAADWDELARDG